MSNEKGWGPDDAVPTPSREMMATWLKAKDGSRGVVWTEGDNDRIHDVGLLRPGGGIESVEMLRARIESLAAEVERLRQDAGYERAKVAKARGMVALLREALKVCADELELVWLESGQRQSNQYVLKSRTALAATREGGKTTDE
jgi:hypothetical protein